jgi:RNA polymerase sigma-B factor
VPRTRKATAAAQLWNYHRQKLEKSESIQLRNEITVAHRGLVRKIAYRVAAQCAEPFSDLEQMGYFGLVKAIERFDPTTGNAFSSFAVPYIQGAMLHFLRDHGSGVKIPRRWRETNSAINRTERAWANVKGRLPTEQELADQSGIKLERIREVRAAIAHQTPISFDQLDRDLTGRDEYESQLPTTKSFSHGRARTSPLVRSQEFSIEGPEPGDHSQLERAWSKLRKNLSALEASDRSLIEALYYQKRSRKEIAFDLQIDNAALKAKIQQILIQIAS